MAKPIRRLLHRGKPDLRASRTIGNSPALRSALERVWRAAAATVVLLPAVAVLAVSLGVSPAGASGPTWTQLLPSNNPPALQAPSMAFDAATDQLILTGESSSSESLEETWLFDGSSWTQLQPATSPPARYGASLAYDPDSGQLILYGGLSGSTYLSDTWNWNGSTWTNVTPLDPAASPSGRDGASLAYDSATSQLVLFGGTNGSYLDDTWIWDDTTTTWVEMSPSFSPPGRSFAVMAFDPAPSANELLLFSGYQSPEYSDVYFWDGTNWSYPSTQLSCGTTPGEYCTPGVTGGATIAYDSASNQLLQFGGQLGGTSGTPETYQFDWIADGSLTTSQTPTARDYAAMAYDPDTSQIVLFGGNNGGYLNDTWVYGLPPSFTVSLSASSPTVAGVETVPPSAVPTSPVTDAAVASDAASAPLSSIPLSSIGLASSPLSSIPLSSIPLSSIALTGSGAPSGLAAAQQALESTLLADLSISYPQGCGTSGAAACTGWQGVLEGTPFENSPLESVTLADVLENQTSAANLDSVDLAALNLASSPLSSIPLSSIELGATPLSSIGLGGTTDGGPALASWCAQLLTVGFSCADFGISTSGTTTSVTLLSLALAGVPLSSIPLSSIPLSSISLSSSPLSSIPLSSISLASNPLSSIPLSSIPLSSIPLSSIPLSSIPLSSIPLSSIPLSSIGNLSEVVNCGGSFDCSGATLGDADSAGAILPGATLGQLGTYGDTTLGDLPASLLEGTTVGELLTGDDTSAAGYPDLTLGDLLLSTIPPATYQWQTVNLSALPLAADETSGGTGGTVTYTTTMNVNNASVAPQIAVTLPPTFAYVSGTSALDGSSTEDPVTSGSPATGPTLTWTLPLLSVGTHTLTFEANAGIGLGPALATESASVGSSAVGSSTASVDVIDGEEPQVDAASSALPLGTGTLNTTPTNQGDLTIGYLTSAGDLNDWTVTVPQGAELSLALSNLPANYDLELFGPGSPQLQGTPDQNLGGVTDTLPSVTTGATTEATPGSGDLPVTPPPGDQLEAISNNSGEQSQYIQTTPLTAGTYMVQVSGYNGAFSSQPYLLQANILGGATAPSCTGGISYLNSLASTSAASGPVDIPSGANTLFLVDTQRLTAAYGAAAESQIMTDLEEVASDSSAGVNGAIVPVDAYASVQSAYAAWNANSCSVNAANAVVSAVSSVVDQIRADNPTIQNLVIVGADDQIPFARIADGATQSNERDYGASTFAGENNPEADALSLGYYLSDDPFAAETPLGLGSATLYLPQLAVGRLIETPAEIENALGRFVSSGGDLDATASLTTGYSFLTSGAQAVSANLAADGLKASTLINESWQESDLDNALAASPTPGVDSINAHFDYSRLLPASDNASGVDTDLFTTTDVRSPSPTTSYAGRLLFSMGCHAGLDVDDDEISTSGVTTPVDDWDKTFADAGALWVANAGYGYADTDTIAYSALLMTDFAANLNGSLSIGEALSEAKQQYAAGNAILSPYDLKALMESTFYGLPMYHLNGTAAPVAPTQGPATSTDPATGLTAASFSVSLPVGTAAGDLTKVSTSNGNYYEVNGSGPTEPGTQVTEYRPIEPLVSVPATEPGLVPHGALVTGLTSTDTAGFTPAYSMPATGTADATPPSIGDAAFPGTLQRVATYGTFGTTGTGQGAQLDLVAGQFFPNASGGSSGTQRIFNSMAAQVFFLSPTSPLADDYTPATIDTSAAVTSPSGVNFDVQVTPSSADDPVSEVLVLYTDATDPGTWNSVTLTQASGGLDWTGTGSATSSGNVQYIVEAVDAAGNVAVSNNEGADFNGSAQSPLSIALSGSNEVDGYYTGPVTATITAASGSTYVLDGSAPAPVPSDNTVVVSSSGEHTLSVESDGVTDTQAFAISTTQTTTVLSSSVSPSVVGQPVTLTATVAPASSGAGTPTGSVEFFDGGTPIAGCTAQALSAASDDIANCPQTYGSAGTQQITAAYSGDSTFSGSSSGLPWSQVVDQNATNSTLSPSTNPSVSGQTVTYTATVAVSSPGTGTAKGYVEFTDSTAPIATCGGGSGVLLSATSPDTATCQVTYTASGSHTISAIYLGDPDDAPSSSSPLTQSVNKMGTTTAVASSVNPSVVGQAVTYTATVTVGFPGKGTPTGSVEFYDGSIAISGCTAQSLSATDTATCKVAYATAGSHTITAKYLGSSSFTASAPSSPLTQSVNKVGTTTVVVTLPNPSTLGKTVSLVVGVGPNSLADGVPTGYVEFFDGTTPISGCGGAKGEALGILGLATCTATFSTAGANSIVAEYLGTGSFATSTSSVLWQIVTKTNSATLSGCNLSGLNLAGANLAGNNLSGANLAGANLAGANLSSADLAGANLSGANLAGTILQSATLTNANLSGDNLSGDNLAGANLSGANASVDNLSSADLVGTNASGGNFASDNLEHANLTNANFTNSNLSKANLTGATITGAKFTGANEKGTVF